MLMLGTQRSFDVPCTVDLEQTAESLHAYVELDGYDAGPGDEVTVHGAPTSVPFGSRIVVRCHATVKRAGPIDRALTHIAAYLELTELYEVGFQGGSAS